MSNEDKKYTRPEKSQNVGLNIPIIEKKEEENENQKLQTPKTNNIDSGKVTIEQSSASSRTDETDGLKADKNGDQSPPDDSILNLSIFRQASSPVLYSIVPGFRKTTSNQPNSRYPRENIQGRARMSTIDPNTLGRLKTIRIEALHEDHQIELAILILQKEFEDRTATDIDLLVKCTQNVAFFKKYDQETHRLCMNKASHVHLKKGDTCVNHGEFGETFWITLKGKVAILIPKEVEIVNKKGEVRKEKVPTKVATEGAGYAFGELSLLERKPRAATIVCEEDSDFAILDKEHFQQILRDKEEQRLFTEVNFLKSLKIFEQWSYNSIRSLFMYCHVKDITRNQVVYGFGEPSEYMYIIKSGEFKISTRIFYEDERDHDATIKKFFKKAPTAREVELTILGPGEIFGVEDIISNKCRTTLVTCISQSGQYVEIRKKEVKALILNEHAASSWLMDYLKSREKIHAERTKTITDCTKSAQNLLMRINPSRSSAMQSQPLLNHQISRFSDAKVEKRINNYRKKYHNNTLSESVNLKQEPSIDNRDNDPPKTNKAGQNDEESSVEKQRKYLSQVRSLDYHFLPSRSSRSDLIKNIAPLKLSLSDKKGTHKLIKLTRHQRNNTMSIRTTDSKLHSENCSDDDSKLPRSLKPGYEETESNILLSPEKSTRVPKEINSLQKTLHRISESINVSPLKQLPSISAVHPHSLFDTGYMNTQLSSQPDFTETMQRCSTLENQFETPEVATRNNILKKNFESEASAAIRSGLNLDPLHLSEMGKQGLEKRQQVLYNQTIHSVLRNNFEGSSEKTASPLIAKLRKQLAEPGEQKSENNLLTKFNQAVSPRQQSGSNTGVFHRDDVDSSRRTTNANLFTQQQEFTRRRFEDRIHSFRGFMSLKNSNLNSPKPSHKAEGNGSLLIASPQLKAFTPSNYFASGDFSMNASLKNSLHEIQSRPNRQRGFQSLNGISPREQQKFKSLSPTISVIGINQKLY